VRYEYSVIQYSVIPTEVEESLEGRSSWRAAREMAVRDVFVSVDMTKGVVKAQRNEQAAAAVARVREIYAELASRPIERSCTRLNECCRFKLTGRTPYLTKGEALVAAKALRATGRKTLAVVSDGTCPLLDARNGKCLIYNDRPFGCRTHFCAAAGGPYARREVSDLIQRLEVIDADLGGDGASALPHAVAEALKQLR
jgi:Fe-S-cluster containining protein